MAGNAPSEQTNYKTTRLGVGRHNRPGAVVCVMELASMLAGERFSDHPQSVCPVIGAILRGYNDGLDDERRPDLYRYAAESVGTRASYELQLRRARAAIAWASESERERGRLRRALQKPAVAPRPDDGPDQIACYVVGSLGRPGRWSDKSHAAILSLLDLLIAMGAEERWAALEESAGEPARPATPDELALPEVVEVAPQPIEHGSSGQDLLLAEVR